MWPKRELGYHCFLGLELSYHGDNSIHKKEHRSKNKTLVRKGVVRKLYTSQGHISPWDRMAWPIGPRGWAPEWDHTTGTHFGGTGNCREEQNNKELFNFLGARGPGKAQDGSAGRPVGLTSTFRSHPARGTVPSKISPFKKITHLFSTKRKGLGCVVIYW